MFTKLLYKFANMTKKKYTKEEVYLLAIAFKKHHETINRWIASGNDKLTSDKAKQALKKKTI